MYQFHRSRYNAAMNIISLQSGSNGNCIYVESRSVRLLFDAGISGRQAETRLGSHGRSIRDVDALIISHNHSDHCRCMGIYQRKFGLPLHVTEPTLAAARRWHKLGRLEGINHFDAGSRLQFGDVTVETHPTPHDGVDGVAFVVDDGQCRFGILTDLGHVFDGLREMVDSLDAVLLESNYDPARLVNGPYPESLKARIRGRQGHLSNVESAALLNDTINGRLQWVCLGHLSEQNNDPELALHTHRRILGRRLPLYLASRYTVSGVLEV
jgi:phosphoribosyl 1,2-cyclic phosphodiesterase